MKKILSLMLALCLLILPMSVVADATTLVEHTVSQTYTVSVPEYIEATPQDKTEVRYTVTAEDMLIPYNYALCVSVIFDSQLAHINDNSITLDYDMYNDYDGNAKVFESEENILVIDAGNVTGDSTEIYAKLTSDVNYAGVYTDTVTFVSRVISNSASTVVALFDANNMADNGNMEASGFAYSSKNAGNPTITNETSYTLNNSLKCFGSSSQNRATALNGLPLGDYYVACKVKVDRYVQGNAGVSVNGGGNNNVPVAVVTETTNGEFVTASGIATISDTSRPYFIFGSTHSADLDCYIDDVVIIPMSVFGSNATKEDADALYEEYLNVLEAEYDKQLVDAEKDTEAFIDAMNIKAKELGLTNTSIAVASGEGDVRINTSTAKDIMKLMYAASKNDVLNEVWENTYTHDSADGTYTLNIQNGVLTRTKVINTTIQDETLLTNYKVLGGKTGTWGTVSNIAVVAEINGQKVIAVTLNSSSDEDRYEAINDLLGIASNKLMDSSYDISNDVVEKASSAIACVITDEGYEVLYEQDADTVYTPASIAKVLTALTALDYVEDYKTETVTKQYADINGDLQLGDRITYEDALYAMMLPSSNEIARIVAREVGAKI